MTTGMRDVDTAVFIRILDLRYGLSFAVSLLPYLSKQKILVDRNCITTHFPHIS